MCLVVFGVLGLLSASVKMFFTKLTSKFGIRIFEKDVSEYQKKISNLILLLLIAKVFLMTVLNLQMFI